MPMKLTLLAVLYACGTACGQAATAPSSPIADVTVTAKLLADTLLPGEPFLVQVELAGNNQTVAGWKVERLKLSAIITSPAGHTFRTVLVPVALETGTASARITCTGLVAERQRTPKTTAEIFSAPGQYRMIVRYDGSQGRPHSEQLTFSIAQMTAAEQSAYSLFGQLRARGMAQVFISGEPAPEALPVLKSVNERFPDTLYGRASLACLMLDEFHTRSSLTRAETDVWVRLADKMKLAFDALPLNLPVRQELLISLARAEARAGRTSDASEHLAHLRKHYPAGSHARECDAVAAEIAGNKGIATRPG